MAGAGGGDDADDLKLQGPWASPHVLRVRLALGLKGVRYEYVDQLEPRDPDKDRNMSSLLLLLDSSLPVLQHGGERVRGTSLSLVQYVDEAFPGVGPPILPDDDPSKRALARYLADVVDDTLTKAMYKASWGKTDGERAEGKSQAAAAVETLEKALGEQCPEPFFGGDTAGYVDVALGGLLPWVRATDHGAAQTFFDPATAPLLAAWTRRFGALEAVDAVMPEEDELLASVLAPTAASPPGLWSEYGIYSWVFVSLCLPRVSSWWRSILYGPVDAEEKQMDWIPWVAVTLLSMAFSIWLRPRNSIALVALFFLYAFANKGFGGKVGS